MFDAEKIKNEIVLWIRDFFDTNGKNSCAVVGISGGKDSSIVAALCVQALGKDKVYGILMPQGNQKDIDIAKELVEYLGIKYSIINIKNTVDTLLETITKESEPPNEQESVNTLAKNRFPLNEQAEVNTPARNRFSLNEQAKINIPARIRMTTLYAVSAAINGFVANTCNLSEEWVGYSTKYGDSAGDFSPLANLTVTEVKAIGKSLNLPSKFTEKIPEDGLSGLTDEENLGFSYDVLDKYIREGICDDKSVKDKIDKLHIQNRHKQELILAYKCE